MENRLSIVEAENVNVAEQRGFLRRQMRRALTFLPNLVKLAYRLLRDPRVAATDKFVLAASIVYVVSPLDFLPDMIPFIGQIDDSYLIAVALLRLFQHTDAEIVRAHWDGDGDISALLNKIARLSTFFLPKRIQKALVGRVETPQSVADFASYAAKRRKQARPE